MALLDTFFPSLKAEEKSRMPLGLSNVQGWSNAFTQTRGYNYERAIQEGFLTNPIAQRAVRIVAEGVGQAPMTNAKSAIGELLNATSAGQSLLETLAAHVLLHGNGYVQIIKDAEGNPIELFALRPDRIRAVLGSNGWPTAYEYKVGSGISVLSLEDEDGWPNIVHIKAMHPLDDHVGASASAAAQQAVAIHNAASEWNRSLLENAARPSGALVYETGDGAGLTKDQFDRLRCELEAAFSGSVNAGRPMLLDGGLKWQKIAMSPADMDFATLKNAAAREIALAFGVPPMLLGIPGDNTYSNYREANRALWRLTLLPLAEKLFSALQEGLAPWHLKDRVSIDLDQITALSEDRERLWKQVSEADFLTRSEKRELLGFSADASQ